MHQGTRLATSLGTSCHSRIVDLRFQALVAATPRGSLAASLWPTGRLLMRFRGSLPCWRQRRRADLRSHRGSGVGSEQAGHCSWHPLLFLFYGRIRTSVTLGNIGGVWRGAFLLILMVLDYLTKTVNGLSIEL